MSRIVEENDGAEDEGEFVLFHGIVYLGAATIEDPRDEDRVRISMSELGGQVLGKIYFRWLCELVELLSNSVCSAILCGSQRTKNVKFIPSQQSMMRQFIRRG